MFADLSLSSRKQLQQRYRLILSLLLVTFNPCFCFLRHHHGYSARDSSVIQIASHKSTIRSYVGVNCQITKKTFNNAVASSYAEYSIDDTTSNKKNMNDDSEIKQEYIKLGKLQSAMTKIGMITFIAGMCVSLPLTLLPINILQRIRIISTRQREFLSLRAGELCSFVLLRLIPFTRVQIINDGGEKNGKLVNDPSIWVCNHSSMIDVFILMATIRRNRPIKVIYWKGLEANPVTRWLFKSCGFIPVQMAANGSGVKNEYDRSSFKEMLKSVKKAFEEGFDLGVLPEGQLNPTPENGLLEVYPGAYTLSKMSRMPIRMAALYGTHHLWHPLHGMKPTSRNVKLRIHSKPLNFKSSEQFIKTFEAVVGYFGATGKDLPQDELQRLLSLENQSDDSDIMK